MQDICETLCRRSGRLLSDESHGAYAKHHDSELTGDLNENIKEAPDENIGVYTEYSSQGGMRFIKTLDHHPGEPGPVSPKERANFDETKKRLEAELRERSPPLKPRRRYRARHLPMALAA
jgi:hypothetical protein